MLKVRDLPEKIEALVNLLPRYILQTFGSEALNCKRTHHAAVEHRRTKHGRGQFRLRRNIAVETAGKGVACACRINHLSQR